MKLKDVREAYYQRSTKASDVVRQLGFAGIAVIWIFTEYGQDGVLVPEQLLWPGGLIVVAFGLDLLQYAVAAAVWGAYGRAKEKEGLSRDEEFLAPAFLNWPAVIFFWAKMAAMCVAYLQIGIYVIGLARAV